MKFIKTEGADNYKIILILLQLIGGSMDACMCIRLGEKNGKRRENYGISTPLHLRLVVQKIGISFAQL
jgi:hypothetical protein